MLRDLVRDIAHAAPEADALLGPGPAVLDYGRLAHQVDALVRTLRGLGLAPGDRVAIVLPNGPAAAIAFLAAGSAAVAAPLNPAYRAAEFDYYLDDLRPAALVTSPGSAPVAAQAAASHGVRVLELHGDPFDAPGLTLRGEPFARAADPRAAGPLDPALVLHTSGTTSRPKQVELTGHNLCTSARNIRTSLGLTRSDRCLNVMPLFHVHGLVGAVLSSLAAGGSVACTPGFDAAQFFAWIDAFAPTWYTAVPAMHQAILRHAAAHAHVIAARRLRFIRSCSAPLAPAQMQELEQVFGVPVVEAFGMTEAAHQIASNPLPPARRKPGSVGIASGVDVGVADERGRLLPRGATGEVVIRGESVTSGYVANAEANAAAFTGGWFRTGDVGHLDGEGYLFLTGRIKEMINKGGEKISPREIDDVLLSHPAVSQALTFAVPHRTLGQDVAAAVVLRPDASASEADLRSFVSERSAPFKVPGRIHVLDSLPQGPTGKLQRMKMAEVLGLAVSGDAASARAAAPFVAPRTALERRLAAIWADALRIERIGIHDRFTEIGGDSLLGAQVIARVQELMSLPAPDALDLSAADTVAAMAEQLERARAADES